MTSIEKSATFFVEYAKSNYSNCDICSKTINYETVRIGLLMESNKVITFFKILLQTFKAYLYYHLYN